MMSKTKGGSNMRNKRSNYREIHKGGIDKSALQQK